MALYTNQTGKLKEVKEKPFKLEKDIQKVFEENLTIIMAPMPLFDTHETKKL